MASNNGDYERPPWWGRVLRDTAAAAPGLLRH
jgi:hypothetical protein